MEAEIQRLENKLYVSNPWPYFLWSFGAGDQEKGLHIATIQILLCANMEMSMCAENSGNAMTSKLQQLKTKVHVWPSNSEYTFLFQ